MFTNLRTLGTGIAALAVTGSAFAVLPTVTLDPTMDLVPTSTAPAMTTTAMPVNTPTTPVTATMTTAMPTLVAPTMNATNAQVAAVPAVNPAISQIQRRLLASIVARNASGQEVLVPVNAQTPITRGMILEYHGYIINHSQERVRNMKVSFDLPKNTELTAMSDMSPARAMGSMDGMNFQYMPLKSNVGGVLQDLPMSYYKAVRWNIEGLGLNEVAEVKYRVVVK